MLTKETIDNLLQHYGYLRQELKDTHDWFKSRAIQKKIDALEELLDIKLPSHKSN